MYGGVFEFSIYSIKNNWCYIHGVIEDIGKMSYNFIGGKDGIIFGSEEMYGGMVGVFVATYVLYIRFL